MRKSGVSCLLAVCLSVLGLAHSVSAQTTEYAVYLQAQSGHYVVAESGGNDLLYANRTSPGNWETFRLIETWDYNGALVTGDEVRWEMLFTGTDVIASIGGPWNTCGGSGATVHTYPSGSINCRKFYIYKVDGNGNVLWDQTIENGDQVAISSYDGYWLSADGGGGGNLAIDKTAPLSWETFYITFLCKGC